MRQVVETRLNRRAIIRKRNCLAEGRERHRAHRRLQPGVCWGHSAGRKFTHFTRPVTRIPQPRVDLEIGNLADSGLAEALEEGRAFSARSRQTLSEKEIEVARIGEESFVRPQLMPTLDIVATLTAGDGMRQDG